MKLLLTFVTFLFTITLFSQDFEGVVTYKMSFSNNKTELSIQQLEERMGSDVKTYFKDGYYLEETNSDFMSYQQYSPKDSTIYYKNNIKSDTIFFNKVNKKTDEEFTYKIEKKTDTILDYVCDKLTVKDQYGTKVYYYSSKLSLNPDYYEQD